MSAVLIKESTASFTASSGSALLCPPVRLASPLLPVRPDVPQPLDGRLTSSSFADGQDSTHFLPQSPFIYFFKLFINFFLNPWANLQGVFFSFLFALDVFLLVSRGMRCSMLYLCAVYLYILREVVVVVV